MLVSDRAEDYVYAKRHVVNRPHGQEGDGLADGEGLADLEPVDVHIGVEQLKLGHPHAVAVGDGGEGVPGPDGVVHLLQAVGGEHLPEGVNAADGRGGGVLPADAQGLHKLGQDGVFGDIGGLDALQHGGESGVIVGGPQHLALDSEHRGLHHLADLIEEVGLHIGDGLYVLPQADLKGVADVLVQVVVVAQDLRGPVLHPCGGGHNGLGAVHQAQVHPVHAHPVAGAIEGAQHAGGGEGEGGGEKDDGLEPAAPLQKVGQGQMGQAPHTLTFGPEPGGGTHLDRGVYRNSIWITKALVHAASLLSCQSLSVSIFPLITAK